MEKLNSLLFRTGKNISVVLCILFMLIVILAVFGFTYSFKKVELNYPVYSVYVAEKQLKTDENANTSDTRVKDYYLQLNEISKRNGFNKYGKEVLVEGLNSVQESKRNEYVQGLDLFLNAFQQDPKSKKNGTVADLQSLISGYNYMFERSYQEKELEQLKLATIKYVSLSVFVSSILFFILCLILPVLIKIEENTRK